MRRLTKGQKGDIAALRAKRDENIDFSDVPEVVDWTGAEIGKFYRPRKKPVTMRLDADVLDWLRAYGRGYQTKANLLLRHAMASSRKSKSASKKPGRSVKSQVAETAKSHAKAMLRSTATLHRDRH